MPRTRRRSEQPEEHLARNDDSPIRTSRRQRGLPAEELSLPPSRRKRVELEEDESPVRTSRRQHDLLAGEVTTPPSRRSMAVSENDNSPVRTSRRKGGLAPEVTPLPSSVRTRRNSANSSFTDGSDDMPMSELQRRFRSAQRKIQDSNLSQEQESEEYLTADTDTDSTQETELNPEFKHSSNSTSDEDEFELRRDQDLDSSSELESEVETRRRKRLNLQNIPNSGIKASPGSSTYVSNGNIFTPRINQLRISSLSPEEKIPLLAQISKDVCQEFGTLEENFINDDKIFTEFKFADKVAVRLIKTPEGSIIPEITDAGKGLYSCYTISIPHLTEGKDGELTIAEDGSMDILQIDNKGQLIAFASSGDNSQSIINANWLKDRFAEKTLENNTPLTTHRDRLTQRRIEQREIAF